MKYDDDFYENISGSDSVDISSVGRSRRPADSRSNRNFSRGAGNKPKKKSRSSVRITALVLSVVMLLTGGALCSVSVFARVGKYSGIDTSGNSKNPTGSTGEFSMSTSSEDLLNDPYVLNVLLIGVDVEEGTSRSDTMMLLSVDNRHKKLKLTSFMRDTYVYVPEDYDAGYTKLTNAFNSAVCHPGGAALTIKTLEVNYGVRIDRYASVDYSAFKKIIDIMGGVDIELSDDEIRYINCQIAQNNQSDYLPDGTYAGLVHLNGQQALWYARNRGGEVNGEFFAGSDWDRTERQRKFLDTVIGEMKNSSLTEILGIVNSVGPYITTNLKQSEITTLVVNSLTYLGYPVEKSVMPPEGTWGSNRYSCGDVIEILDWDKARLDFAKFIYEDSVS